MNLDRFLVGSTCMCLDSSCLAFTCSVTHLHFKVTKLPLFLPVGVLDGLAAFHLSRLSWSCTLYYVGLRGNNVQHASLQKACPEHFPQTFPPRQHKCQENSKCAFAITCSTLAFLRKKYLKLGQAQDFVFNRKFKETSRQCRKITENIRNTQESLRNPRSYFFYRRQHEQ